MSIDRHRCRQLGPCYGHLEHFILVRIPIYDSDLCPEDLSFFVFALCHNGPAFYDLFTVSRTAVHIYSMTRKVHVVGNSGLSEHHLTFTHP